MDFNMDNVKIYASDMLMLKLQGDLVFFAFATDSPQEGIRICSFPVVNLTSSDTNDMVCL